MSQQPSAPTIPCIIFVRNDSFARQRTSCEAAIEAAGGRVVRVVTAGDRTAAIRDAADLAAEYGRAELWVSHSTRLARADLPAVFRDLRRQHVAVRSVEDQPTFTLLATSGDLIEGRRRI